MKKRKNMYTKAEVVNALDKVIDNIPEAASDTKEALKIAKCEISWRKGQYSKKHSGKIWTEYEIEKLCDMFDDRETIGEICNFLGRTEKGIAAKLRRLGKISERKEMYSILDR